MYCVHVLLQTSWGTCYVYWPVSRDRQILVMKMEAGKAAHVAYLLLILT